MSADITKEIHTSLNDKYSTENKARMLQEEEDAHARKLAHARDHRKSRKTQSRATRMERKSVAVANEQKEKERVEKMSLEEKAALARQERRSKAEKSAGLSEMFSADEADKRGDRLSVLAQRSPIRPSVSTKLASIVSPLSPLAKSISTKTAVSFNSPDDITLLSNDDFWQVNDHIRNHAAPKEIALPQHEMTGEDGNHQFGSIKAQAGRITKKSSIEFDQLLQSQAGNDTGDGSQSPMLPRTGRATIIQRFNKAINKSASMQKIDFDLAGSEKKVVISNLAVNAAGAAGDGAIRGVGAAATGTAKLTGAFLRMTVRATRLAAKVAAPHIQGASTRAARMTMGALDVMYDGREKKMTAEEKKRHRAAKVIQKKWRVVFNKFDGPKVHRAARIITRAVRHYKEMVMREKWEMVIKMELKDRKERVRMEEQAIFKAGKDAVQARKKNRVAAENIARKSGWSAKDGNGVKWSKKEMAIMAACFLKNGFPDQDSDWFAFYNFFADKPRRAVRSKLNGMKEEGILGDNKTLAGCPEVELEKMGLGIQKKKEVKKKVMDIKDLV
jgi:hypothetical protein